MAKVGKSVDLTNEPEPVDAVLIMGEAHERLRFELFGARIEADSRGVASKRRNSVTARTCTALITVLYGSMIVAGFAVPATAAYQVGATTTVSLIAGISGAVVSVGVIIYVNHHRRGSRKI
jgi:hypothetical protein